MKSSSYSAQAGFTLLELLVVLAILGAMLSLVAPNISVDSSEDELKREAQSLGFALQQVADKAWLSGATTVVTVKSGDWNTWIPVEKTSTASGASDSSESSQPKIEWQDDGVFHESLSALSYDVDVTLKDLKQALSSLDFSQNGQLIFLANGEYLPFSILIKNEEHTLTVAGDGINAIEIR